MESVNNKLIKDQAEKTWHQLLKNVGIILKLKKNTEALDKQFDDNFTVFSALGFEEKELKHCQIIYSLLNPEGKHGMGDIFLRQFFITVMDNEKYESATVKSEYDIRSEDNSGRIDLYIKNENACYPIEVKINADDQETQIYRYHKFAKDSNKNKFTIFYLTLNGKKPKAKSTKDMTDEDLNDVKCISFKEEILPWLRICAELAYKAKKISIYGAIHQYITLIEKLTIKQEEKEHQEDIFMNSITEVMALSGEYFNAAKKIAENFDAVQPNKMKDILQKIQNHMQKTHHLNGVFEQEEIDEYYSGGVRIQKNATVSLEFRLDTYAEAKVSLNLVFEICGDADSDDQFYYGVVIKNANTDEYDADFVQDMKQDIANIFNNQNWKDLAAAIPEDKCWVWWKNLPSKSEEPNFRKCDDNYLKLYNPADYEQIMNEIFKEIDTNLEFIRNNGVPPKLLNVGTWL